MSNPLSRPFTEEDNTKLKSLAGRMPTARIAADIQRVAVRLLTERKNGGYLRSASSVIGSQTRRSLPSPSEPT